MPFCTKAVSLLTGVGIIVCGSIDLAAYTILQIIERSRSTHTERMKTKKSFYTYEMFINISPEAQVRISIHLGPPSYCTMSQSAATFIAQPYMRGVTSPSSSTQAVRTRTASIHTPATVPPQPPSPLPISSVLPHAAQTLLPSPLFPSPPAPPATHVLVWFRNDLRLHDHPALHHAIEEASPRSQIIPIYIFDPRNFQRCAFGFRKTGIFRANFLLQSVSNLRTSLREKGSDLIIRIGHPEVILPALAHRVQARVVMCHSDVLLTSGRVQNEVQKALHLKGIDLQSFWSNTLFHLPDLPFPLQHVPDAYTTFRNAVHANMVRDPLPSPRVLPPVRGVASGELPRADELAVVDEAADMKHVNGQYQGGEDEGLRKLNVFVSDVRFSRPDMGVHFICRLSPWLSLGCVSPRRIFASVNSAQASRALASVFLELVWRDFFRFVTAKLTWSKIVTAGADEKDVVMLTSATSF